jgi:prepilin-type N-terminal cleavage/methylation domain-containing protein
MRPLWKLADTGHRAFTLLEVLIALALVAILLAIAIPYMKDSLGPNQSDQISEAIVTLAQQTRLAAMKRRESRYIDLNDISFRQLFPAGWKFELERMGDQKFHEPHDGERWEFNSEGICDPLSFKIEGPSQTVTLQFDPITAELTHDE